MSLYHRVKSNLVAGNHLTIDMFLGKPNCTVSYCAAVIIDVAFHFVSIQSLCSSADK